jgi:histidinol-phosphate phosphatase family protein
MTFDIVIPTVGRDSLRPLLEALTTGGGPRPGRVLVVDDRRDGSGPLPVLSWVEVLPGQAAGPAAARNLGWRRSSAAWVAFLDDDVVPGPGWLAELSADLDGLPAAVAASQGRVRVPMPSGRRPTDWERNVRGLETARWATADMAYRRSVLEEVGGFDERFPRAYREDADLGLRVVGAGYRIVTGQRVVTHPVRPAGPTVSLRLQAGNADDVLMRALHGREWRAAAGVPRGRRRRHLLTTGSGVVALVAAWLTRPAVGGRRTRRVAPVAWVAGAGWALGTAELALARIRPGPRTPREVATMSATSVLLPPLATWHWLAGWLRLPRLLAHPPSPRSSRPKAVLFDRDGTLVEDVPYNGDPDQVVAMPGAREAVERLRAAGVATAVVSNQSGVARGRIRVEQVAAVNRRVEELLGPLGPWMVCPHGPWEGCGCRKPAPGLIEAAAGALGVQAAECVVIGDIGADVEAARAAGARGVLVPTPVTRMEEVAAAPEVAADLLQAVELVLGRSGAPG